jgi:hypothetical protein
MTHHQKNSDTPQNVESFVAHFVLETKGGDFSLAPAY